MVVPEGEFGLGKKCRSAPATGHDGRALGFAHFVVRNSYIQGAHSGMFAYNKVVAENNYITTNGTDTHQSGMRMLKNSTLRGNTVFCQPVASAGADGGCSADAVFYREFGVPTNLTIERNYFPRNASGGGQWFAIRFVDCRQQEGLRATTRGARCGDAVAVDLGQRFQEVHDADRVPELQPERSE